MKTLKDFIEEEKAFFFLLGVPAHYLDRLWFDLEPKDLIVQKQLDFWILHRAEQRLRKEPK